VCAEIFFASPRRGISKKKGIEIAMVSCTRREQLDIFQRTTSSTPASLTHSLVPAILEANKYFFLFYSEGG
jgi:hypothetical protein